MHSLPRSLRCKYSNMHFLGFYEIKPSCESAIISTSFFISFVPNVMIQNKNRKITWFLFFFFLRFIHPPCFLIVTSHYYYSAYNHVKNIYLATQLRTLKDSDSTSLLYYFDQLILHTFAYMYLECCKSIYNISQLVYTTIFIIILLFFGESKFSGVEFELPLSPFMTLDVL